MMTDPPQSKDSDQICPICQKLRSKHTNHEMLECSRKLQELNKDNL